MFRVRLTFEDGFPDTECMSRPATRMSMLSDLWALLLGMTEMTEHSLGLVDIPWLGVGLVGAGMVE
jgi:hypothetical protein